MARRQEVDDLVQRLGTVTMTNTHLTRRLQEAEASQFSAKQDSTVAADSRVRDFEAMVAELRHKLAHAELEGSLPLNRYIPPVLPTFSVLWGSFGYQLCSFIKIP